MESVDQKTHRTKQNKKASMNIYFKITLTPLFCSYVTLRVAFVSKFIFVSELLLCKRKFDLRENHKE